MRTYIYLLIGISFLSIQSCTDSNVLSSEEIEVSSTSWTYDNPLSFTLPVLDTTNYYDLSIHVKHSPEFSFQNLYVSIESEFPDGEKVKDIVSLELADKKGKWIGSCNSKECNAPFLLKQNIRFEQLGTHHFNIGQESRQDSLSGIESLSIVLLAAAKQQ